MIHSQTLSLGYQISARAGPRAYNASFYLFTLLGVGLLNYTNHPLMKPLGLSAMAITGFLALLGSAGSRHSAALVGIWLPMVLVYTFALFNETSPAAIWTYGQLVASWSVFAWASQAHNNIQVTIGLSRLAKIVLFFAAIATGFCVANAEGETFTNSNTAAEATVCFIFLESFRHAKTLYIGRSSSRLISWIGAICLLGLANSRSCWVEIFVFAGAFLAWKAICRSWLLYWASFALLVVSVAGFTLFLVNDASSGSYFDAIQDASWHYTQKNFDTRSGQWTPIVWGIQQRPWTGWGLGTRAQFLGGNEEGMSAHSQYLELGMRAGYPGIAAITLLFCGLWAVYWHGRHRPEVRVSGAILLAVMVQQTFEVNLLQSGLCIGFIWWVLLGLGAGSAIAARTAAYSIAKNMHTKSGSHSWQRVRR